MTCPTAGSTSPDARTVPIGALPQNVTAWGRPLGKRSRSRSEARGAQLRPSLRESGGDRKTLPTPALRLGAVQHVMGKKAQMRGRRDFAGQIASEMEILRDNVEGSAGGERAAQHRTRDIGAERDAARRPLPRPREAGARGASKCGRLRPGASRAICHWSDRPGDCRVALSVPSASLSYSTANSSNRALMARVVTPSAT